MKYCPNCNTPLNDNAKFCPNCGSQMSDTMQTPPPPQQQQGWSPAQQPQTWTQNQKQRNNVLIVTIIAVAAVVICGLLLFIFISSSKSKDNAATDISGYEMTSNTSTGMDGNQSYQQAGATTESGITTSHIEPGAHTFNGVFNFKGADYPFEISFNFDPYSHQADNALYTAVGTGATNKITSMIFSDNDNHVTIKGPSLRIQATRSADGSYKGTMTRGNHSGSIIMYL